MAADNEVSLGLVRQRKGECSELGMSDHRVNGLLHQKKDEVMKVLTENGRCHNNGHQTVPKKMLNGLYKNHHKTPTIPLTKDGIVATSLRSSPTRNKTKLISSSESMSNNTDSETRLTEEVKLKDGIQCKWMDCGHIAVDINQLADHATEQHIDPMKCCDVFVCLWQDCKVFNRPSCSLTWLVKHLESHIGVKPFKCVIDGCLLSFSSQHGLARHVPCHFHDDTKPVKKPPATGKEESPSKRNLKRKRLKYIRYKKASAKTEDFVDQHAVDNIKSRLSSMIVTDTDHVGIDGGTITFKSQAWGKRVDKKGHTEILLHWIPESIIPDEWVPSEEVENHLHRCIAIRQLPNDVKAELHPSFYRRLSHRKERRK